MSWFRRNILTDEIDECEKILKSYQNGEISEMEYVRKIDKVRAEARELLENNSDIDAVERKIIERDLV